MNIEKTTNFSAGLSVTPNGVNYVQFNGAVDAKGKPNVDFYIADMDSYREHVADFMAAFEQFQKTVFDYSNDMLKELNTTEKGA